jgi:ribulose kinase
LFESIKREEIYMTINNDVIYVSAEAARRVLIHAKGSPAQIVAVGVAAACTFVGTAVGYGLYRGGEQLFKLPFNKNRK